MWACFCGQWCNFIVCSLLHTVSFSKWNKIYDKVVLKETHWAIIEKAEERFLFSFFLSESGKHKLGMGMGVGRDRRSFQRFLRSPWKQPGRAEHLPGKGEEARGWMPSIKRNPIHRNRAFFLCARPWHALPCVTLFITQHSILFNTKSTCSREQKGSSFVRSGQSHSSRLC